MSQRGSETGTHIAIVGLGLIGGSLALAVKRAHPSAFVTGVDRPDVLEKAAKRLSLDELLTDTHRAVARAQVVFLATPVFEIENLLAELADVFPSGAIVTDAGSTKRRILSAASRLSADVDFIGGHPMAGKESSGLEAADADLFLDASWALVPRHGTPDSSVEQISELIRDLGAKPILTNAEDHDRAVAVISHLPQIVSVLLCQQSSTVENALHLAGPTFKEMARLARSPYGLWREILESNHDQVSAALLELSGRLKEAAKKLKTEGLEENFRTARKAVEGKLSSKSRAKS